ncbi:MAG: hypothetical protein IID46_06755, partial [Planctomycetes bacterium]|nr:hypothetical protein [Planctomycetota bacterium]
EGELNSPSASIPATDQKPARPLAVWFGIAWFAGFLFFFYSFTLPNSDPPQRRVDLWKQLPDTLLANIETDPAPHVLPSGWSNFYQRFDLMQVAAVILAGAWGLGHLLLRIIKPPLDRRCAERTFFAFALGLSGLSLLTLGCGLAGRLSRPLLGGLLVGFVAVEVLVRVICFIRNRRVNNVASQPRFRRHFEFSPRFLFHAICLAVIVPFLLAMFLGSMLPSTDFDVKEYHLQGPKEFFEAGHISFLPHNVYTSFPFLTEMLSLLGMVLSNNWYRGALAGKLVLMSFAPLTGLGVYIAGRRWFSPTAGWLAALIFLSTPWTYRIAIIAYAEGGLSCYLFAALLAVMIAVEKTSQSESFLRQILLCGLLAGSAMACKYPGALQVVIPLGVTVCVIPFYRRIEINSRIRTAFVSGLFFSLGVFLTVEPWLIKNSVETGNPVYPLMYTLFGGEDWDADLNAKWRAGHSLSADRYTFNELGVNVIDVTAKSDWLSPLLFGLAPLALFAGRNRRLVVWLWLYVGFLFFAWWLFTHRIDRFWVPMIPVVSLLAGIGAAWHRATVWRCAGGLLIAAAVLFNLGFVTTGLCGNNMYLADLNDARRVSESFTPGIASLNKNLPDNAKVLCVGEAQVFDARFPLVYNTVFDRSIFEEWCALPNSQELRDPDEILRKFHNEGITHVFVNWQEVLRYRSSYGYTDFVSPRQFLKLEVLGVLGRPVQMGSSELSRLDESEQSEVKSWAPELIIIRNNRPFMITMQVYPVRR